jgi:hypothetical protein
VVVNVSPPAYNVSVTGSYPRPESRNGRDALMKKLLVLLGIAMVVVNLGRAWVTVLA